MLGGLAAAHANVGDMLLVKGYAAGFDSAGIVLYLVLTLGISAPHGFDEAGLVRGDVKELFIVMSDRGARRKVVGSAAVELVVNIAERIGNSLFDVVKRHNGLFAAHAGYQHAGACLDVARTELRRSGTPFISY